MNRNLSAALTAALLLAAGQSWALGLGQIEVKSRRNQPLLAEIPVISTTPGELAALRARLASPDIFQRIGLPPPQGITADLQFSLGRDARGRPVIRVTTSRPVDQGALNFLIEVEWGSGRLVREYSALIDVPDTAAAVVAAPVQLPQPAAEQRVQRPESEAPAAPVPAAPSATPVNEDAVPVAASVVSEPLPESSPSPEVSAGSAVSAAARSGQEYGPVKPGESATRIATRLGLVQGGSLDQALLALMRANPQAFIGGDVNRLRQGAVLRLPRRDEVAAIDPDEATREIGQQLRRWGQAQTAVAAPQTQAGEAPAAAPTAAAAPVSAPKQAGTQQAVVRQRSQARLQILPPASPGKAKGIQTGTQVGGEGSMLQQQLRQRDEEIAAKSAEISELKERVAELERLKDEQQKLIALKDTELAAAQARLADIEKRAAATPATPAVAQAAAGKPATAKPSVAPAEDAGQHGSALPYVWGGLGFAVLAALAWWFAARRRAPTPPPRRRVFDAEALAASMVMPPAPATPNAEHADVDTADSRQETTQEPQAPQAQPVAGQDDQSMQPPASSVMAAAEVEPSPQDAHALPDAESAAGGPASSVESPEQKLKLVRAFLDMGDEHSAQQLLVELLDDPDDAVSEEAARMLSKLVG